MDLNDIVVFTKVVETKSFTGAADALGLPKSTVSRKLAQLEERLGVRLVQRTTRKLALTDIGEVYYARCSRIVADVTAAEQLVTDMQATPRGRLRITAPVDLSSRYLGAIVSKSSSPRTRRSTSSSIASDRVVDLIEEGFDVAVRFGPLPESTLIARRLYGIDFRVDLVRLPPAYLAKRGTPTEIEMLDDHDRVTFTPASRNQTWNVYRGDAVYEFGGPAHFASNNILAVRDVLLAGGGIALIPDFMVACEVHNGTLTRLLPEWRARVIEAHAVYPARQNLPPRLSLFLDHLAAGFNPPPWTQLGECQAVSLSLAASSRAGSCRTTTSRPLPFEYLIRFLIKRAIAIAVFVVGRWLARLIVRGTTSVMERSHFDISVRKFLGDMLYAVLLIAVLTVSLDELGVQTTAVVAVLGAAGLTIGLALQGSLSNFAAGVMLLMFRPYKVGDLVVIGKYCGRVDAIRIFQTLIVTADYREITIPNSQIISAPIENLTVLGTRRVDIVVSVAHGTDLREIKTALEGIVTRRSKRVQATAAAGRSISPRSPRRCDALVRPRPWVDRRQLHWTRVDRDDRADQRRARRQGREVFGGAAIARVNRPHSFGGAVRLI